VQVIGYDGTPDRQVFDELNALIERRPFSVHISRRFPLAAAAQAHQALTQRHLGRMILTVA
jgi:NADPH:quinone reductase-like Zn-dependent oxidoreductase